ncbi:hypothetical protein [Pseudodesulfovibrio sp. zrk46]|uniref:hypothetical protein n=1 Tax=Pseudodesulfovibrio sp. zrk46 TaxID=2725288 RepID=UPI0014496F1B|nr:hypothetical protein [Pseudodesulfovibrio sp. zrk46]QJB55976.1 hypothetical protein HFN16_05930 [Pseudodesulfovibrio sp. zrk46]
MSEEKNNNNYRDFFVTTHINRMISSFLAEMNAYTDSTNSWTSERNMYIKFILNSMKNAPDMWDQNCQISIESRGDNFRRRLESQGKPRNKAELDHVYTACHRFLLELDLSIPGDLSHEFAEAFAFGSNQISEFDIQAQRSIKWTIQHMPISIMKNMLKRSELVDLRDLGKTRQKVDHQIRTWQEGLAEKMTDWDKRITGSEAKTKGLLRMLKQFETGAHFVGLHLGFKRLRNEKEKEMEHARTTMGVLGLASIAPILIKLIVLSSNPDLASNGMVLLGLSLPVLSLTAIGLYFFRVALMDYKSTKSQLLQLDLRMSLCEFIQSYSEYKTEIEDKEALNRFEQVVFSGIVSEESKIPAAFDGLEQLAKVINTVTKAPGTKVS